MNGSASDVYTVDNGYRLRIERAQISHTARYTCRAENIAGQAEKYFDLSVLGNWLKSLLSVKNVYVSLV